MRIERDTVLGPEVRGLLREHLASMHSLSPPESVHALDVEGLLRPDVTFWAVWEGQELMGCGALKELDPSHGEIKSMRTPERQRRRGAGRLMLEHILAEARARGYKRLSLETGSLPEFEPARRLYASYGFVVCGPFGEYKLDPYSVFMTLELS